MESTIKTNRTDLSATQVNQEDYFGSVKEEVHVEKKRVFFETNVKSMDIGEQFNYGARKH